MSLQEARVGAAVGNALIEAIEDMDLEIEDGVFECAKCRKQWELEEDTVIIGLCGDCYNPTEEMVE